MYGMFIAVEHGDPYPPGPQPNCTANPVSCNVHETRLSRQLVPAHACIANELTRGDTTSLLLGCNLAQAGSRERLVHWEATNGDATLLAALPLFDPWRTEEGNVRGLGSLVWGSVHYGTAGDRQPENQTKFRSVE